MNNRCRNTQPFRWKPSVGDKLDLSVADARILEPAAAPVVAGYHLVESLVQVGDAPQRRLFKIKVNDPQADADRAATVLEKPPTDARWQCVDLSKSLNGDIRTIFQQKYLSPRPQTCSLRLATNGYSTWQMSLGEKPKGARRSTWPACLRSWIPPSDCARRKGYRSPGPAANATSRSLRCGTTGRGR